MPILFCWLPISWKTPSGWLAYKGQRGGTVARILNDSRNALQNQRKRKRSIEADNLRDVPKEQRIEMLARGEKFHTGKFGNEGSGGQSYLIYPWEAGKTYRFLTEVIPNGRPRTPRQAQWENVWVRDIKANWHECKRARL